MLSVLIKTDDTDAALAEIQKRYPNAYLEPALEHRHHCILPSMKAGYWTQRDIDFFNGISDELLISWGLTGNSARAVAAAWRKQGENNDDQR